MRLLGGFSLIELLVVLVVLGILFTIGLFSVVGVRGRAYDAVVQTYLREAVAHQFAYALEHGDYAADPGDLVAEGLRSVPGIELRILEGGASFCMLARHLRGRYWFAATPRGLFNTGRGAGEPPPADCP